ncbi:anticodon nuclease [Gallibacterium anatis]|uniref:anticodon nuclease n=1 Tax=Gallibacterium anatis TaxID=750 RepID=UPI003004AB48
MTQTVITGTITEIAQKLKDTNKKVQLIYAFNGVGKTLLSREFKKLVSPKYILKQELEDLNAESNKLKENGATENEITEIDNKIKNKEQELETALTRNKILYYNSFTEDLFYWDNNLSDDFEHKLIIQPNSFIKWIIEEEGKENDIISTFQEYTNDKLTPMIQTKENSSYEVTFSLAQGNNTNISNIKISQGEERNFIWSIFYTLIKEVLSDLEENNENSRFNELEYIFIDDPVSSLDDNYLISLAIDLSIRIKKLFAKEKGNQNSEKYTEKIKFIITTHNPLFYNVLFNELRRDDEWEEREKILKYKPNHSSFYILDKNSTEHKLSDSGDTPFSYHIYLKNKLDEAIKTNSIEKISFSFY